MADIGDNAAFVLTAALVALLAILATVTVCVYYGHKSTVHGKVCREQPSVCIAEANAK